ncbi:MAG: HAD family hydrolase [Desulfovibrio sp.]|nr:MAG: HAD family hydrolase [Desulfovibrio sp.]
MVFDFDGTLAELTIDFSVMKANARAIARAYLTDPLPGDSLPVLEWADLVAATLAGHDPKRAKTYFAETHAMIQDMEMEGARQGSLFPFTRPLLEQLALHGTATAIITRNCARAVHSVFPDLDGLCPVFLARDHVDRVKPDPGHLLAALDKVECSPDKALMVGDHPLDVETGKRAGAQTAGVATGRMSLADLQQAGADHTAQDMATLARDLARAGIWPELKL